MHCAQLGNQFACQCAATTDELLERRRLTRAASDPSKVTGAALEPPSIGVRATSALPGVGGAREGKHKARRSKRDHIEDGEIEEADSGASQGSSQASSQSAPGVSKKRRHRSPPNRGTDKKMTATGRLVFLSSHYQGSAQAAPGTLAHRAGVPRFTLRRYSSTAPLAGRLRAGGSSSSVGVTLPAEGTTPPSRHFCRHF